MRRTAKTNSNTHTAKEGAKGSFFSDGVCDFVELNCRFAQAD